MTTKDKATNVVLIALHSASKRFAGKALVEIVGKPVLQHLVERYSCCRRVSRVIVTTTMDKADDPIASLCLQIGVNVYRGHPYDVVDQMNGGLLMYEPNADTVFRGLGDMLFVDTELVDWRFDHLRRRAADVIWPGLPDDPWPIYGSRESPWSRKAWGGIVKRSKGTDREHAGQWLYNNLAHYRVLYTEMLADEYYQPYRFELDTQDDLLFFREVFKHLYKGPGTPKTVDVIRWLDKHPEVAAINSSVPTKTLTTVDWDRTKKRGWLWKCKECGATPMDAGVVETVTINGKRMQKLTTSCTRCGEERDFYEASPR